MSEQSTDLLKAAGMCPHGNFPTSCRICLTEAEKNMTPEMAREILGARSVSGSERVKEVFGTDLERVPDIPFSRQELERAKETGEKLILRIDRFDQNTPVTVQELVRRSREQGRKLFASASDISDELDWVEGMAFQSQKTPKLEWKLVKVGPLEETKHLSYDAQQAFIKKDFEGLQSALDAQVGFWDELLEDENNTWLREHIDQAKSVLPTMDDLRALRESLPDNVSLPV